MYAAQSKSRREDLIAKPEIALAISVRGDIALTGL